MKRYLRSTAEEAPSPRVIYLFTHKRWEVVRNSPDAPTHNYWAVDPKNNKRHGPFIRWSIAREYIDQIA